MPPSDSEGLLSPKQVAALRAAPITYRDRVQPVLHYAMVLADIRQLDIETATGISHSQLSRILNGHTGRGGKIESSSRYAWPTTSAATSSTCSRCCRPHARA